MRKNDLSEAGSNVVKNFELSESKGVKEWDVEIDSEVAEKRKTLGPTDGTVVPNYNIHAL